MFCNYKFLVIFLVYLNICINSNACGSELRASSHQSNEPNVLKHRMKRGGNSIPFRPLFVYRAQQKELKAKWKLIDAQKLFKQQQQKLQSERENQQNLVRDDLKQYAIPTKSDYAYRLSPVYPINQANPSFPGTDQKEYASVNSYSSYPTYFRPSYDYRQIPYYDEYYSDY